MKDSFDKLTVIDSEISEICGIEGDMSSEWNFVGGSIKGSYVIKNGEDNY